MNVDIQSMIDTFRARQQQATDQQTEAASMEILPVLTRKESLEAQITRLETERTNTLRAIDALVAEALDYDQRMKAAQHAYDLEGNDAAQGDIVKFRNLRDDTNVQVQRQRAVEAEFPVRIAAIRDAIGNANHRADLQQLAELKATELEAYGKYEAAALALADSYYDFRYARALRENTHARIETFSRANNLPIPYAGNFGFPYPEPWWGDVGLVRHLKQKFAEARQGIK